MYLLTAEGLISTLRAVRPSPVAAEKCDIGKKIEEVNERPKKGQPPLQYPLTSTLSFFFQRVSPNPIPCFNLRSAKPQK